MGETWMGRKEKKQLVLSKGANNATHDNAEQVQYKCSGFTDSFFRNFQGHKNI